MRMASTARALTRYVPPVGTSIIKSHVHSFPKYTTDHESELIFYGRLFRELLGGVAHPFYVSARRCICLRSLVHNILVYQLYALRLTAAHVTHHITCVAFRAYAETYYRRDLSLYYTRVAMHRGYYYSRVAVYHCTRYARLVSIYTRCSYSVLQVIWHLQ